MGNLEEETAKKMMGSDYSKKVKTGVTHREVELAITLLTSIDHTLLTEERVIRFANRILSYKQELISDVQGSIRFNIDNLNSRLNEMANG